MPDFFVGRSTLEAFLVLGAFAAAMIAIAIIAFRVRSRYLVATALMLGVFQGFVPFSYISWFILFAVALVPAAIARSRSVDRNVWCFVVAAIAIVQAASVLWSPTVGAAAHAVLSVISLGAMYLLWSDEARQERSLSGTLILASPAVLIFAGLVWIFRFFPSLESSYLASPLARFLSEPGIELVSDGRWLNVFDPDKSGAFMLNGNIASLFLLLLAVLYLWAFVNDASNRRWFLLGIAAVSFGGVFVTGSKSPLAFAVIVPLIAVAALFIVRRVTLRVGLIVLVVAAAGLALIGVVAASTGLLEQGLATMATRSTYWQLAVIEFPAHWFLGLGFGGWEIALESNWSALYGEDLPFQGYPPHNLILQAWAETGVVGAALAVTAAVLPVVIIIRAMRVGRSEPLMSRTTIGDLLILTGLLWTPMHGLTDTTTFFGDNHTIPAYAALVALAYMRLRSARRQAASIDSVRPWKSGVDAAADRP